MVTLAEHAGKPVHPVIVPTNEPIYRPDPHRLHIGRTEIDHGGIEQVRRRDQLDQVVLYWLK